MIGQSRGDEEIIDDALDMLVWQRKRIAELEGRESRLRRCLLPIQMAMAEMELVDGPVADDTVLLSHSGSGCSDQVTAGMVRAALGGHD